MMFSDLLQKVKAVYFHASAPSREYSVFLNHRRWIFGHTNVSVSVNNREQRSRRETADMDSELADPAARQAAGRQAGSLLGGTVGNGNMSPHF